MATPDEHARRWLEAWDKDAPSDPDDYIIALREALLERMRINVGLILRPIILAPEEARILHRAYLGDDDALLKAEAILVRITDQANEVDPDA